LEALEDRRLLSGAAAALALEIHVDIEKQVSYVPGLAGPADVSFDFNLWTNGTVKSPRFRSPAGLWYSLEPDNEDPGEYDFEPTFATQAELDTVFSDGVYTLEFQSGKNTISTQFPFAIPGTNQPIPWPTQPPVLLSPQHGQTTASSNVTLSWKPVKDRAVTGVSVYMDDKDNKEVVWNWLNPSSTTYGPLKLKSASNYSLELQHHADYSGTNADGYGYSVEKTLDLNTLFRTPGGPAVTADVALTSISVPAATYHSGDTLPWTVTGGAPGQANAIARDRKGKPMPVYHEIRLSKDTKWGNADDILVFRFTEKGVMGGEVFDNDTPQLTLPANTPPGVYYLAGMVDVDNGIAETNEKNNLAFSSKATITIKPNAAPTVPSLAVWPDPPKAGQKLYLSANGIADPDGQVVRVEFYLDSNKSGKLELSKDKLLGMDTSSAKGWQWAGVVDGLLAGADVAFLARAQDNSGAWSNTVVLKRKVARV
jgi:hypothetical protein